MSFIGVGSNFMHEEFDGDMDDIRPITGPDALAALREASKNPAIPFSVIYTLRLLVVNFFRDNEFAAEEAEEQLDLLYSVNAEDVEEPLGPSEDPTPPDYSVTSFCLRDEGQRIPCRSIVPDKTDGPQRVSCG